MLYSYSERVVEEGEYIVKFGATIRQTAAEFAISKSCVHNDIHMKLKEIDFPLFVKVQAVLNKNFAEKHIRGGLATKKKFENLKCPLNDCKNTHLVI